MFVILGIAWFAFLVINDNDGWPFFCWVNNDDVTDGWRVLSARRLSPGRLPCGLQARLEWLRIWKVTEKMWIKLLRTFQPHGLNVLRRKWLALCTCTVDTFVFSLYLLFLLSPSYPSSFHPLSPHPASSLFFYIPSTIPTPPPAYPFVLTLPGFPFVLCP